MHSAQFIYWDQPLCLYTSVYIMIQNWHSELMHIPSSFLCLDFYQLPDDAPPTEHKTSCYME